MKKINHRRIKELFEKKYSYEQIAKKTGLPFNYVRTLINEILRTEIVEKYSELLCQKSINKESIYPIKRQFYDSEPYEEEKKDHLWERIIKRYYDMKELKRSE